MTTTDTPIQTTSVNRGWFFKRFLLPLIALLGLGVWGLLDAAVIYPKNGRLYASLKLKEYLDAADEARRLTQSFVKVEDQRTELDKLSAREKATAPKDALNAMERARLQWLRSLKMVWALGAEEIWVAEVKRPLISKTGDEVYAGVGGVSDVKHETVQMRYRPASAEGVLVGRDKTTQVIQLDAVAKHLKEYWATAKTPSPLAFYDLPLQWFFATVGFGGAIYLILLYLRVASKRYQYEPATHTLILPGGARIAPGDIKEVDKRKWHKFYVTLHLKDGSSRTLDLMRHDPLEEWVLAMEKVAFPEVSPDEGTKDEEGSPEGAPDDAIKVPKDVGHVSSMTYGGTMDGVFAVILFDAASLRAAGKPVGAYAQGETLKALGVALRDEGGWRQWLTAACGEVRGGAVRTLIDMFAEREATFKAVFRNAEPAFKAVEVAEQPTAEWYAVVIGRLSEPVARRTNDILMDPPLTGFVAFGALKTHPPTIERFLALLSLEPGMEIKGDALVGSWEASREDLETAGLKGGAGEGAAA